MKIIVKENNNYLLRFDRGEELMGTLKQFCESEKISAGFISALGACIELKMAFYNLETKQYENREFKEDLEITNLTGNVAIFEQDLILHIHGSFADREFKAFGGHVVSLVVGGTCELYLTKFETSIKRNLDEATGLKLLN